MQEDSVKEVTEEKPIENTYIRRNRRGRPQKSLAAKKSGVLTLRITSFERAVVDAVHAFLQFKTEPVGTTARNLIKWGCANMPFEDFRALYRARPIGDKQRMVFRVQVGEEKVIEDWYGKMARDKKAPKPCSRIDVAMTLMMQAATRLYPAIVEKVLGADPDSYEKERPAGLTTPQKEKR